MQVERATKDLVAAWAALRHALWPHATLADLTRDCEALLARDDVVAFVAVEAAAVVGFAEARLREYVNGCDSSPVAFVEGLYVEAAWRRRGIARALIAAIEDWAEARGLSELGSDVPLDNLDSQQAHEALGFAETERVVYYRKALR